MARLIDADELLKRYGLDKATKYGNKNKAQRANSYSTMYMYEIADMIDDAPTIDAVEQKHGHWKRELFDGCVTLRCSCCDWSLQDRFENRLSEEVQKLDRCGECGAKMCEVTG